jgi:hypothetical protein
MDDYIELSEDTYIYYTAYYDANHLVGVYRDLATEYAQECLRLSDELDALKARAAATQDIIDEGVY